MSTETKIDAAEVMEAMKRHAKLYQSAHAEGYRAGFLAGVTETKKIVDEFIAKAKGL